MDMPARNSASPPVGPSVRAQAPTARTKLAAAGTITKAMYSMSTINGMPRTASTYSVAMVKATGFFEVRANPVSRPITVAIV